MKRMLLCLLAACGGGDDAPTEVKPPPFMQGEAVKIEITARGAPVPNVQVMFQNADGSVVSVGVTDANGLIGADIDDGGFVTVVHPRPASGRDVLTTFAGVQNMDLLHLDFDELGPVDTTDVVVQIASDPQAEPDTDPLTEPNAIYRVRSNCGETGALTNVDNPMSLLGCGGTLADFVVTSHDENDVLVGSKFFKDVTLKVSIDLTPNNYKPVVSKGVTVTPKPQPDSDDIFFAGVNRALATDRGIVFESGTSVVFDDETDTFESTIAMPDVPGATTMITSSTAVHGANLATVLEWNPVSSGGDYTLDLGTLLPQFVDDGDPVTPVATYAVDTRSISWTETGGNAPDLVRARLSVFRDDVPVGRGWDWRIIAPRTGAELVLPELSVDLTGFDFTPAEGDTVGVSELTTAKFPATVNLRTVREHGFTSFTSMRAGESGVIVTNDLYETPEL